MKDLGKTFKFQSSTAQKVLAHAKSNIKFKIRFRVNAGFICYAFNSK